MGSSVSDINQVQIEESNGTYTYKVFSEESFLGGTIKVILSKTRDTTDVTARLVTSTQWFGDYGTCSCEKTLLEGVSYLYLYILDAQEVSSNVVRVFLHPPKVLGYQVALNGMLDFMLDTASSDYQQAEKLVIEVAGGKKELVLPNCSVYLPELGIWNADETGDFKISFSAHKDHVDIFGQPLEHEMVLLLGPSIDSLSVSNQIICFTGDFRAGSKLLAEIRIGSYAVTSKEVTPNKNGNTSTIEWDIKAENLDPSNTYTCCLTYLGGANGKSKSIPGKEEELILLAPELEEVRACEKDTIIQLKKTALYEINSKEGKKILYGNNVRFTGNPGEITFRFCQEKSYGPAVSVSGKALRFQRFLKEGNEYYLLGEGGEHVPEQEAIVVPLGGKLPEYKTGEVFSVSSDETESSLTIGTKYLEKLIGSKSSLYDEFEEMLSVCAKDNKTIKLLVAAVIEHAPFQKEDVLFFLYRYRTTEGRVDLLAGMKLSVEYAIYQNIPEGQRMLLSKEDMLDEIKEAAQISHINGYVGTGTCEYQIVNRNGKVVLEPFVQGFLQGKAYEIPAPSPMDTGARIDGGADGIDFLFEGMAASFLRLLYPNKRTDQNNKGELRYFQNICLAAANTLEVMTETSASMRRQKLPGKLGEVSIAQIRGRASITVKIMVFLNGEAQWVSLGTTMGDLLDSLFVTGETSCALYRQTGSGVCPVFGTNLRDMYLVSGDRMEVNQVAADTIRRGNTIP